MQWDGKLPNLASRIRLEKADCKPNSAEPSDMPRIVQLQNQSFADSPVTPILFPGGHSQDADDAYVETLLQRWQKSASWHVKVIDTDLDDKIIAFANWYTFVGEDVKFIKTDPNERQNRPGSNPAAANEFHGGILRIRIKLLGKNPHCRKSHPAAVHVAADG